MDHCGQFVAASTHLLTTPGTAPSSAGVAFWRTAIASAQEGSEQLFAESSFRNTSLRVHSREPLKFEAQGTDFHILSI